MDQKNRPRSREKNYVSGGGNVYKRGSGLGTGPVGNGSRPNGGSGGGGNKAGKVGGGFGFFIIVIVIIYSVFIKPDNSGNEYQTSTGGSIGGDFFNSVMSSDYNYSTTDSEYQAYQTNVSNTSHLDNSVAGGSRAKYTTIYGNKKDKFTIMVYLCGTDLESKSGMGTADLSEMCNARLSDKVNLLVYTGGCKQWKNNTVSNSCNQIYQVKNGGLVLLEKDMGNASMTKPETLSEFIKYCTKNYPANRQALILWDHGSGSISGYGYDEKNSSSGSMTLAGIDKALNSSGAKFDFIGFDACLMATVENGLMLSDYADYLIASEETEPGVGWYYTNWLNRLSSDTSMPTVEVGQMIIDDFVTVCDQKCRGQKTTLSITDLAELSNTVPSRITSFAKSTNDLIADNNYEKVANARNNTKEFAQSSKIDQIDFVHFARNMGTSEGNALADALMSAVKYNRTASSIRDAYGLSIYFPYKKASKVDQVVNTYAAIGMDSEYARCIQEFASLEVSGQVSQGGAVNPAGSFSGSSGSSYSGGDYNSIFSLLGSLSSSGSEGAEGIGTAFMNFLSGRSMSTEKAAEYISNNSLDPSHFVFTDDGSGKLLKLTEDEWKLVMTVDLNVFVDDGNGYIDLGLDNTFDLDSEGNLIGNYDNTWLSIDGQIVPYYHTDTTDDGTHYSIFGYVPAFLNGERVELQLVFSDECPHGYISGAKPVYKNGETDTVAKTVLGLKKGDELEFICDYYRYDGTYDDSYLFGNKIILGDKITIGNADIGNVKAKVTYRFTDIYQQQYWSDSLTD